MLLEAATSLAARTWLIYRAWRAEVGTLVERAGNRGRAAKQQITTPLGIWEEVTDMFLGKETSRDILSV